MNGRSGNLGASAGRCIEIPFASMTPRPAVDSETRRFFKRVKEHGYCRAPERTTAQILAYYDYGFKEWRVNSDQFPMPAKSIKLLSAKLWEEKVMVLVNRIIQVLSLILQLFRTMIIQLQTVMILKPTLYSF